MESVDVDGASIHKGCFKCVACGVRLSLTTYVKHGKSLYCKRDVPRQDAKVGLSMTLCTAMEAQRLASSAASSGDAVARYASAAPAKDSPAKASPTPSKTPPPPSPFLESPLRRVASPVKQELEQTTPAESPAKEATPAESPAKEATPAESPAKEATPAPEPEPSFPPGSPEAQLEAELAQVVEKTLDVAEEITEIIGDVEKKAAAAEPAASAAGGKKKKKKGKK
jgi:hypothetical protein